MMHHDSIDGTAKSGGVLDASTYLAAILMLVIMSPYWPVVSALGAVVVISILVWVHFGRPARRRRGMKHPCDVWFDLVDGPAELTVPANSRVEIDFRIRPKLKYECRKMVFGFVGDKNKIPIPISVSNKFVARGKQREVSPDDDENHFVDVDHQYHQGVYRFHTPPDIYAQGYRVETREPGRYKIDFMFLTDEGEGTPSKDLFLVVK